MILTATTLTRKMTAKSEDNSVELAAAMLMSKNTEERIWVLMGLSTLLPEMMTTQDS